VKSVDSLLGLGNPTGLNVGVSVKHHERFLSSDLDIATIKKCSRLFARFLQNDAFGDTPASLQFPFLSDERDLANVFSNSKRKFRTTLPSSGA